MRLPSLTAEQWLELKILCGDIYQILKSQHAVPDDLNGRLLGFLALPEWTMLDYFLYGSIQFKAITPSLTLLYIDMELPATRQVFVYPTPRRQRVWHSLR